MSEHARPGIAAAVIAMFMVSGCAVERLPEGTRAYTEMQPLPDSYTGPIAATTDGDLLVVYGDPPRLARLSRLLDETRWEVGASLGLSRLVRLVVDGGGSLYLVDLQQDVRWIWRVDEADGRVIWERALPGTGLLGVAAMPGRVFVASCDGLTKICTHSLHDADDWSELWTQAIDGYTGSVAFRADGDVVFLQSDGGYAHLTRRRASDGAVLWVARNADPEPYSTSAIVPLPDGDMVVGSSRYDSEGMESLSWYTVVPVVGITQRGDLLGTAENRSFSILSSASGSELSRWEFFTGVKGVVAGAEDDVFVTGVIAGVDSLSVWLATVDTTP